jgi:nucleotide-binding universal stress UspA family protein
VKGEPAAGFDASLQGIAPGCILVPVDFEASSRAALAMARELGERLGAQVVLLHAYELPAYAYPGVEPLFVPALSDAVAAAAAKSLGELAAASGGLRSVLRQGDVATEILDVVRALKPRLVVVGTHGRRGVSRVLLGSIAEKVVRTCPVPVLTVRAGAEVS